MKDYDMTPIINLFDEQCKKLKQLLTTFEPRFMDPHEVMDCIEMTTIEDLVYESSVPACCTFDCWVEPDGFCEHGHPSVLLELGLI